MIKRILATVVASLLPGIVQPILYKGSLKIVKNGEVVLEKHNLVVTAGKYFGVSRLISNSEFPALASIGVGSSSTAPDVSQADLIAGLANQVFDAAAVRNNNSVSMTTTFGPGVGTGTIAEAGLFNGTGAGKIMFSRSTFTGIPKGAGDTVSVTWTVTAP